MRIAPVKSIRDKEVDLIPQMEPFTKPMTNLQCMHNIIFQLFSIITNRLNRP
jgi:hypothetical protein